MYWEDPLDYSEPFCDEPSNSCKPHQGDSFGYWLPCAKWSYAGQKWTTCLVQLTTCLVQWLYAGWMWITWIWLTYVEWISMRNDLCGVDFYADGSEQFWISNLLYLTLWRLQRQAHEPWNLEIAGGVWRLQFAQQCLNTFRGQASGLPALTLYCNSQLKWMPRKAGWSIDEVND